jgi:hypothetical protein
VISSATSAPAVLPSRSCAPSNAFAAVATTEIASDNLPMILSTSGLICGALLARAFGRAAHGSPSSPCRSCALTNPPCPPRYVRRSAFAGSHNLTPARRRDFTISTAKAVPVNVVLALIHVVMSLHQQSSEFLQRGQPNRMALDLRVFVPSVISRIPAPRFKIGPVTFEFIDPVTTSDFGGRCADPWGSMYRGAYKHRSNIRRF